MVTQFLMAVPMVILYGFSILIADYVSKSTNEEDINENNEDKNNNKEQEKEDIK